MRCNGWWNMCGCERCDVVREFIAQEEAVLEQRRAEEQRKYYENTSNWAQDMTMLTMLTDLEDFDF